MTQLTLFGFLSGALLAFGLLSLARTPLQRRLARFADDDGAAGLSLKAQLSKLLEPLARRAGGGTEETRQRLVQAGFRDESALSIYTGGRLVLPLALGLLVFVVTGLAGSPDSQRAAALIGMAAAGYFGPSFLLDKLRGRRQGQIRRAIPDALDLLVVCLEAGLSMGAAFSRVAREFSRTSPPLCQELRLVTAEMQAGKSGADALRSMSDRIGIEDVSSLVAMLIQSERFGTSVADALRIHCDGMRKDRLQRAEERAQKAAVRLLIPAGVLIFPATLIVLLGPAVLIMFETLGNK